MPLISGAVNKAFTFN